MRKNNFNTLMSVNIILLGLLMLVPGLTKLFGAGTSGVSMMLSGNLLFSWAPMFWAIILIIGEIGSGVAILTRWKLRYVSYIPVIILGVAVLTVSIKWSSFMETNWSGLLFHLIAIVNYLMLASYKKA